MSVSEQKMRRTAALYNTVPSFFWSVVNLVPVSVFCYRYADAWLFWTTLGIASLSILLPRTFFKHIQLSSTPAIYRKVGVHFINRFTQHGAIVNQWVRKKYPTYKVVPLNRQAIQRHYRQTYMFEKFHFMLFVFFAVMMCYALVKEYIGWSLVLLVTNILYNIYPILLQQYVRIKLRP